MTAFQRTETPVKSSFPTASSEEGGSRTGATSELSVSQEQIWLDDQINPGTAVYNIPIAALHFEGPLDADVLEPQSAVRSCNDTTSCAPGAFPGAAAPAGPGRLSG